MASINSIFLSLLGGVLPALLWLWFWLKEDGLHPEPKKRIALIFLVGMCAVLLVLPIEKYIFSLTAGISLITIVLWAAAEELLKYIGALVSGLKQRDMEEPIDAVIYMITAALGFSALENALFLFNLLDNGLFTQSIITGNSRFLGATLLHVATSAVIGVFIGFSFYKRPAYKKIFLYTGFIVSVILHTIFNLLIIKVRDEMFFVFAGVWVCLIILIVLIEKIKKVKN